MKEERYGREASLSGSTATNRADDVDVVGAGETPVVPPRAIVPSDPPRDRPLNHPAEQIRDAAVEAAAAAGERESWARARSRLRAVERPASSDRLGTAVETVGATVGWTTGYVKSRRPSEIRADTEKLLAASPALALVAAVGFGYLLGSLIRR